MSGSRKKTPIGGMATAVRDKQDERLANRRLRRAMRHTLHVMECPELLPRRRELSNPWTMAKDRESVSAHWNKRSDDCSH